MESRATKDLRRTFEFWSYKDNRVVELKATLTAAKATNLHVENGSRTKEPRYHGKVDFSPEPPSCSATPEEEAATLYLAKDSFGLAKACFYTQKSGLLILDKTDSCPEGMYEQARPGVPNTSG